MAPKVVPVYQSFRLVKCLTDLRQYGVPTDAEVYFDERFSPALFY